MDSDKNESHISACHITVSFSSYLLIFPSLFGRLDLNQARNEDIMTYIIGSLWGKDGKISLLLCHISWNLTWIISTLQMRGII